MEVTVCLTPVAFFSAISKEKRILLNFINFHNGVITWQRSGQKKFNVRNLSPIKKFLLKKLAKVYGHRVAPARRGLFFSSVF